MSDDSPDSTGRAYVVVGVFPGQPDRVVREAARFARHFDAELVCAHVDQGRYAISDLADGTVTSLPFDPDIPDLLQEEFDVKLLQELTDVLAGTGISWSVRALAGDPAAALARLSDTLGATMIVVGSRRPGLRGGLNEFIAGSVAAHLAHRQGLPVVVIPLSPVAAGSALPWE
jgi:nucleotide-binding universal stress UspA family protein